VADSTGSNSTQVPQSNFSATFPASGIAVGAQTAGIMLPLQLDASGNLRVTSSGGGSNAAAGPTATTVPGSADYIGANVAGNLQGLSGVAVNATTFALDVNVITGTLSVSATNPSVGTTGGVPPAQANYLGVNVGGTFQGQSGLNIVGTTYVAQTDLSSVGGHVAAFGQALMATSFPVVIASNQSSLTTIIANASLTTNINNIVTATITGTPLVNLTAVGGSAITLGSQGSAASLPVVIANNQGAIPISGSITATNPSVGTTGSTAPTQATLIGVNVAGTMQAPTGLVATTINATAIVPRHDLSSIGGTALAIGQAAMAASMPVVIASNQSALTTVVSGTVTVVGSTTSFNLVQVGNSAITLGAAASVASLPVVIATNQAAIPISGSITATNPSVGTTATAIPAQATLLGINVGGSMRAQTGLNIVGTTYVAQIDNSSVGGIPYSLGSNAMASSMPVTIATDQPALPISGTLTATFTGTSAVNITQVGGTAIAIGSATMASSFPVVIASDQKTLTTIISGTPLVNLSQVGGTAITLGSAAAASCIPVVLATNQTAIPISGSITATNPSVSTTATTLPPQATLIGGRAQTGEVSTTAYGNGNLSVFATDLLGKPIVIPYANKENWVAGVASSVVTTLTQVIASINATNKIYITSMQLSNPSATTIVMTFNDPNKSNFIVPAGGGSNPPFPVPLAFTLGSAVAFTCSVAISTAYVNAQGFSGT
jgi:hypothetical protein